MIPITPTEIFDAIIPVLRAKKVPFLRGYPGIGKTFGAMLLAKKWNLKYVDIRLSQRDPTDLNGYPMADMEKNKCVFLPIEEIPLEGDPIPISPETNEPYQGWLVNWDEFNHGEKALQKSSYKIINERMVGQRKIHPKVLMMATGNTEDDINSAVEDLTSAMIRRFVHFRVISDFKKSLEYMQKNSFNDQITSFLQYKPAYLNNFDPQSDNSSEPFACEATWEAANDIMKFLDLSDENQFTNNMVVIQGCVGEGIAREFMNFQLLFNDLPTIDEIVANPTMALLPPEPGHSWALTGCLSQHYQQHEHMRVSILEYLKRMLPEFRIATIRDLYRRDPKTLNDPLIGKFVAEFGIENFS